MKKLVLLCTMFVVALCGTYDVTYGQRRVVPRQQATSTVNMNFRTEDGSELRLKSNGVLEVCVYGVVQTRTNYKIQGDQLLIYDNDGDVIMYGTVYKNSGGYITGISLYNAYWEPF